MSTSMKRLLRDVVEPVVTAGQVRQSNGLLGHPGPLGEQFRCGRALSWIEPAHELVCRLGQEPTLTLLTNVSLEKGMVKP